MRGSIRNVFLYGVVLGVAITLILTLRIQVNWTLLSITILGTAIGAFFYCFEKGNQNAKEVVLIATMASLAAITRIPFAAIMSFQPTTFIVMITGYVYGVQTAFLVGAIAAFVSNMFLGQGPWTPWQMFCWGLCGMISALFAKTQKDYNHRAFLVLCVICAYVYGNIMTFWHWVTFVYPLNWTTFFETYVLSFPFDTLHAFGNLLFASAFGNSFHAILVRFRKRFRYLIKETAEES